MRVRCTLMALALVSCSSAEPRLDATPIPTASATAPVAASSAPVATPVEEPDEPSAACAAYDATLAREAERYVDAFASTGIELSPDGKQLLMLSDRGRHATQLYLATVDRPSDEPLAIAPAKDRVGPARFTPDGKYVLFIRDHDNDENWQIFRARTDGSELVDLTAAPGRVHFLPRVSAAGKLYYVRAEHKSSDFEIVEQPLAGGEARVLYRGRGVHEIVDLSADGTQLLVTHISSLSRSSTLLLEVASGKATPLGAVDGAEGHVRGARFSADGHSIYLASDVGEERLTVRRLDRKTGAELGRWKHERAEADQIEVAPKGELVAVRLHHGSHTSLVLLDGGSMQPKLEPKLPVGTVQLGRFSADGQKLVFSLSTPAIPSDPQLLSVRTGSSGTTATTTALRQEDRPGLGELAHADVRVERVASFDGTEVPLNLYLPSAAAGAKLPVLVSVHGGPANAATVRWSAFTSFFVARGWAVVEPNVRGSTGFGKAYERADNGPKRMDALTDLAHVNAWLRAQPWADPERLVVYGGSYGGYMTYLALGHQPDRWRAGVGLVGIVNVTTFLQNTAGAIREAFREEFGEVERDRPFLDEISPLRVVDRMRAPVFVYQGATDPRVPRSEQDQLVRALRSRHHAVEYMVAADEGHSLSHRHNQLAFYSRVHRFLDVELGRPGVPPGCGKR